MCSPMPNGESPTGGSLAKPVLHCLVVTPSRRSQLLNSFDYSYSASPVVLRKQGKRTCGSEHLNGAFAKDFTQLDSRGQVR